MSAEQRIHRDVCFVSYSRGDERFALRLAEDLRIRGIAIWLDQLNIRASEHWDRAVERAIRGCCCMLVILSPRAVLSDNVADEITLALDSGKTIIPLMIEPCPLPLRLARMHLIEAAPAYEVALNQCLASIKAASAFRPAEARNSTLSKDDDVIRMVTERLATTLGPIAGILVENAVQRATSVADLYGMLSLHIHDDEERERFLLGRDAAAAAAGQVEEPHPNEQTAVSPDDVQRVTEALTHYLGPIASLVTRRESVACHSLHDLLGRVAATLECEEDRKDFCEQVEIR